MWLLLIITLLAVADFASNITPSNSAARWEMDEPTYSFDTGPLFSIGENATVLDIATAPYRYLQVRREKLSILFQR